MIENTSFFYQGGLGFQPTKLMPKSDLVDTILCACLDAIFESKLKDFYKSGLQKLKPLLKPPHVRSRFGAYLEIAYVVGLNASTLVSSFESV